MKSRLKKVGVAYMKTQHLTVTDNLLQINKKTEDLEVYSWRILKKLVVYLIFTGEEVFVLKLEDEPKFRRVKSLNESADVQPITAEIRERIQLDPQIEEELKSQFKTTLQESSLGEDCED
jgi:hypothetical protein